MRILLVEDDTQISRLISIALGDQGHVVDAAADGSEGESMAAVNDYSLIILDVMLPKVSGTELCARLRREGIQTPILMLTALGENIDIIGGLAVGADDYLTKPFDIGVLLARVRSLTRRAVKSKASTVVVGDLVLDLVERRVTRDGRSIGLTKKEFALFEYFVLNHGVALSRDAIAENVWNDPLESNVVDNLVRCLRQKIGTSAASPTIQTLRSIGYRFLFPGEQ